MSWGILLLAVAALSGCEDSAAVERTQTQLRDVDYPRVRALVEQDLENHQAGIVKAAAKLAPGFAVSDPAVREKQVRAALRIVQQPKKGIDEFVASPMSFLAAVGTDGVVVARDRESDRMKGQDFKTRFEVVRQALGGTAATGLGEFYAEDPEAPSSWSILFAAPCLRDGQVVGAVLAGHPALAPGAATEPSVPSRTNRRARRPGCTSTKADRLFHWDTPPEVDALVGDPVARAKALAASPAGYTETERLQGELQVYGAFPLALLGPDLGTIIFRTPE